MKVTNNNEKDLDSILREAFLQQFSEKKRTFQRTETTPTSNIGTKDIINQINNIGMTLDNDIHGTAETTHEKLDKIIEQTAENDQMSGEEIMQKQISINEYVTLKEDISEIKTSINWLKWLVPIFITIGIFISGIIVNSIKEANTSQYQMLEKKLDTIQKLNSMQIERDVAIEIKNQQTKK